MGKKLQSKKKLLYRVSQKSGMLYFHYFDIKRYSIFFVSSDRTLSRDFEKNDTKIFEIGWVVFILWSFLKIRSSIFS